MSNKLPESFIKAFGEKTAQLNPSRVVTEDTQRVILERRISELTGKINAARMGGVGHIGKLTEEKARLQVELASLNETVKFNGRTFKDYKTFNSEKDANKFLEKNDDHGVIGEKGGKVYVAKMDDMGEELEEKMGHIGAIQDMMRKEKEAQNEKLKNKKSTKKEELDPVGKADADIDNDGDVDSSDKYLHNRRKAISKAMKKEEVEVDESVELEDYVMSESNKYNKKHIEHGLKIYRKAKKEGALNSEAQGVVAYTAQKKFGFSSNEAEKFANHIDDLDSALAYASGPRSSLDRENMHGAIRRAHRMKKEEVELDEAKMTDAEALAAAKKLAANAKDDKTKAFGQGLVDFYKENDSFTPAQIGGLQNIMKNASFQMAKESVSNSTESLTLSLIEKALSKKQQMAAGAALAAKRGDTDPSELVGASKEMYDSMSEKDLEDFAKTKHKGLPMKKEEVELDEVTDQDRLSARKIQRDAQTARHGIARKPGESMVAYLTRAEKHKKKMQKEEAELEEGYTINHKTFSSAVQHAKSQVEKQGYTIDDDEWDRKVAMGPKKPGTGKTNRYTIDLMKGGKETRRKLQMQVYYDEGRYELNMYVS